MQCPGCQEENPAKAKFCLNCGTKLALICPSCQAELPSQAKFCFECGSKLGSVTPTLGEEHLDGVVEAVATTPAHHKDLPAQADALPPTAPMPEFASKADAESFAGTEILTDDTALIQTFLSRSRRAAIARGESKLPKNAVGSCLFADISGFTPLTESLGKQLKPEHGAEVLTGIINRVFEALISQVHAYGGDVLGFAGDAITCWFPEEVAVLQVLACSQAMQGEMVNFAQVATPGGESHKLSMKVGISNGPVQRLLVGAPEFGLFDLMTGVTLTRMALAEHHAHQGEILCSAEIIAAADKAAAWGEDRQGFRVLHGLEQATFPRPMLPKPEPVLPSELLRSYFPPALFDWLAGSGRQLMAELRPVVSAFLHFEGLDYDNDPDVETKLNQYIHTIQRIATHYGGSLMRLDYGDKGNVAHVIFGAPVAHEDDETRAVGWAIDQQTAVRDLSFINGQRIGIAKGQVYAGALGATTRRGYTLMGDDVNASARLMQACQPGQTLVSQRVMSAAHKSYAFHQYPGFQVKGKFEPVPVATPLAPLPTMQQLIPPGPLIGRTAEVEQLESALTALQAGNSGILRIEGAVGVGKSRLVGELVQRAMQRGVRTLVGSCQSVGQHTPYLPWRDIIRTLFNLPHESRSWPAAQQAMQIQSMLQWINPEWLARLPLFGDLLGAEIPDTATTSAFDPGLRRESLFALVSDLMARLAAQQPLLVLVEDCHWIDEASESLIEALGKSLSEVHVLLVLTHRPPVELGRELFPSFDNLPHTSLIELKELSSEAVRDLATARLGGELPREILALVQERSQGNPLFVEELAETLRDLGKLQMVDGRWMLTGVEIKNLTLPDTIQGVVLARLDQLDDEESLTIKVASVIGRKFDQSALTQVHPTNSIQDVIEKQLNTLENREFIFQEYTEPFITWRFKHNATQEVAYGTLLYAQRRNLHRSIAEWYENTQQSALTAFYALLAHHFHFAEDSLKEGYYARMAGEQAAARYANSEALRYLNRALEITSRDDDARFAILQVRERVYDLLGQRQEQAHDIAAMQELAETSNDSNKLTAVYLRQASYAQVTSDYPSAIMAAKAAIQYVQGTPDEAAAQFQWGRALWLQGKYPQALEKLTQALEQARSTGQKRLEGECLLNLGILSRRTGEYEQAKAYYMQAAQISKENGDPLGESKALSDIGSIYIHEGSLEEATQKYSQSLSLKREIGQRKGESLVLSNLGVIHGRMGDYARAGEYYQQAIRIMREIGDREGEVRVLTNLGVTATRQGEYEKARISFHQAEQIAKTMAHKRSLCNIYSNLGLLLHQIGNTDLENQTQNQQAAMKYSQQALQLAQELNDRSTQAEALTHRGHACAALGEYEEALSAYLQSLEIRHALQENNLAIETSAGMARVSMARGEIDHASNDVEEILKHLESGSLDGCEEPMRIYLTCYQVLQTKQDHRAPDILRTANTLLQERAAKIGDPKAQLVFLSNISAHREILALFDLL